MRVACKVPRVICEFTSSQVGGWGWVGGWGGGGEEGGWVRGGVGWVECARGVSPARTAGKRASEAPPPPCLP